MANSTLTPPAGGAAISIAAGKLTVPNNPIIPFIEGDGTGADIWAASVRVLDAAVAKAYGGKRSRSTGWKCWPARRPTTSLGTWLPDETVQACRDYLVSIKGPLTTPVGGGIRSLNVALRQMLDLYVCLRPVRWFKGVPSPVKRAGQGQHDHLPREHRGHLRRHRMGRRQRRKRRRCSTSCRRNSRRCSARSASARRRRTRTGTTRWKASAQPSRELPVQVGIGLKPVSYLGTERLVRSAIDYAIANKSQVGDPGAQGQHHEVQRGRLPRLGLPGRRASFYGAVELDGGPWHVIPEGKPGAGIIIKDAIADAFLQQILLRPAEYDVVATLNLNGDYLSDALAAQVGGIGIAPGANINYVTGHAVFEATHGTAPKYAGLDKVNPGSVILSGEMMLRYMGWNEAADAIIKAMDKAIAAKRVTYDFARLMEGATEVKCSEFADELIKHL